MKLGSVASLNPSVRIGSYPNVELTGEGLAYRVRGHLPGHTCLDTHAWTHTCRMQEQLTARAAVHSAHQPAPFASPCCHLPPPPLQVKLQFESRDPAALQRAVEAVQAQMETFALP